jgi:hypothetical protein
MAIIKPVYTGGMTQEEIRRENRLCRDACQSVDDVDAYLTGRMSEHHLCVDCGVNTFPGAPTRREAAQAMWEAQQKGEEIATVLGVSKATINSDLNRSETNRIRSKADRQVIALDQSPTKTGFTVTQDERAEVYYVRERIWAEAGMDDWGGCLCIGCLEKRLGRRLRPKDFLRNHIFNQLPGTDRLLRRQGRRQAP